MYYGSEMLKDDVFVLCVLNLMFCVMISLSYNKMSLQKVMAFCDLNQCQLCGFVWFSTCNITGSDIHISWVHRFHKLLQVKIFSPVVMVLFSTCLKYFSKKNNSWEVATVQTWKSMLFFLAQKFVDIFHDSKLFGKYRGCLILFPAIITAIHIESAILIL